VVVTYSQSAENSRLAAVATTIDAAGGNGNLILLAGASPVSTIQLARPCALAANDILTFQGTLLDPSAAHSGTISTAQFQDSLGNVIVSGLTAGTSAISPPPDIIMSATTVTSGQVILIQSAKITGA
jgi:hypothetical protein